MSLKQYFSQFIALNYDSFLFGDGLSSKYCLSSGYIFMGQTIPCHIQEFSNFSKIYNSIISVRLTYILAAPFLFGCISLAGMKGTNRKWQRNRIFFPLVLKNPISSPFSIYPFHSVLLLSSIVYKCHVRVRQGVCNRSELLSRSTPRKARVAFLYIVHFKLAEKFTDCLYFWFSLSFVTEDFGLVIWVPSRAFWVF